MSAGGQELRAAALACLGRNAPAGVLVDCLSTRFPDLEVYREDDDLVIRRASRFLVVRRTGTDRFRVSENIAVPSTNAVDAGAGAERSLNELISEIAEWAK